MLECDKHRMKHWNAWMEVRHTGQFVRLRGRIIERA
jgi:hypothetical protein